MAYTASRIGYDNVGGVDATALFLKVYAGEVMTAFAGSVLMKGRHIERTIQHGKSAQ